MASKPIKLPKDTQGQEYYPATTTEAVVDRKRVKALSEILDDIDEAIANSGSGGGEGGVLTENSVNTTHIVDGAVTTSKIAGGAITKERIADNAVTTSKIADGSVTEDKLSEGLQDTISALQNGTGLQEGVITMGKLEQSVQDAINDKGSSVTIVNNLTEGGEDKALSAEMGKKIGGDLYPIRHGLTSVHVDTSYGQSYGTVGETILISDAGIWEHARVNKAEGLLVHIKSSAYSVSSMVQYVDDNDTIISLDVVNPEPNSWHQVRLTFPESATAAYVSSITEMPMLVFKCVNPLPVGVIRNSIYDLNILRIETESVRDEYQFGVGQSYGNVGNKINIYEDGALEHVRVSKEDEIDIARLRTPTGNISSLVQYVDDNDMIISLDVVKPEVGSLHTIDLNYPDSATAVYISGLKNTISLFKIKIANAIGDPSKLTVGDGTIVDAINALNKEVVVDSDAIIDGAVTTEKIADGAVTTSKIAQKAVKLSNLSEEVQSLLGGGGEGASIASMIAYDNVNSDVYPTNVQSVIDTLASRNLTGKYRATKNSEFVLHEGYLAAQRVDQFATITSGASLRYSDPVFVSKGDTVIVRSQGTGIGCICLTDAEASFYKAKAISNDGSQVKEYAYTAERDCYIAISSRAAALFGEVIRDTDSLVERNVSPVREEVIQPICAPHTDLSMRYEKKVGQTYGDVGNIIDVNPASSYQHIVVNKNDGITKYKLRCPLRAQTPSSLVQYVNNSDIIISRSAEGLTAGEYYTEKITWPEGATKVYISGTDIEVFADGKIESGVIGDASKLQTYNQILVDAINEITDIYPTAEIVNAADEMDLAIGQAYGHEGGSMQFSTSDKWRHIKLYKDDLQDIRYVDLAGFEGTSSLIQYVDTNDIVVKRDLINPEAGVVYRGYLDFPVEAEAVYVSSGPTKMVLAQYRKTNVASKLSGTARFRVLSWNIGHYAKGNNGSSTITADTYESQKREFRKVFNKYGADIVGLCEYSTIFYGEETATDAILPQYQYKSIAPTESGMIGLALYSAIKMTKYAEYSVGNGYTAYESHIDVAGKDVIVCICHLPWQSHELNKAAISTILSRYEGYPYVVVMGDLNFNTGYEEDDAKMFTIAGYQVANWGYLGKILTSYNNKIASNYLDNVCVKGGSILHTEVLQNTPEGKDPDAPVLEDEILWDAVNLSDHFPIVCDVEF